MLPALLLMLPVVVVDVGGDRLDPSQTRTLLEKELSVTAVAPDDPRASGATGRIDVTGNAKDGTLTVKYRKVDEPIERTIKLANDPKRAQSDAAFLAGNLARDEAGELAPAEENAEENLDAAPPAPQPKQPLVSWQNDARDFDQMRAFLLQSGDQEKSSRTRMGIVCFIGAAAFVAPSAYVIASAKNDEGVYIGITGGVFAASLVLTGSLLVAIESGQHEELAAKLREHEQKKTEPGIALADVEREWGAKAMKQHDGRMVGGTVAAVLGGLLVAGGATWLFLGDTKDGVSAGGASLMFLGTMMAATGVAVMTMETPVETSYRMWRTVKSAPEPSMRMSFGGGPLPGGGGAASFAVTF